MTLNNFGKGFAVSLVLGIVPTRRDLKAFVDRVQPSGGGEISG